MMLVLITDLSRTPLTPKSGEALLHIAPILTVASIASTAREQLGMYPTTLSPFWTPLAFSAELNVDTFSLSSEKVTL